MGLCCVILYSCADVKPDHGEVEGNHYTNHYFGIDLYIDPTWFVADIEEIEAKSKQFIEEEGHMDTNPSIAMLVAYENEPGLVSGFNPSLSIFAESLKHFPDINNETEFLNEALIQATNYPFEYSIDQDIEKKVIGKNELTSFRIKFIKDSPVYQEYHASILKQYCVNFLLTYQTEYQKEKMYQMLESLTIYSKNN